MRTFVANKNLRVKNWNQNHDPILKLRDGNVYDFQQKSKKEEIFEKLNDLIQLLKYEGMRSRNLEGSLVTSSNNYFEERLTLVISFERTTSMNERSSKDSSSDYGETLSRVFTLFNEEAEKALSSGIFERRNEEEVSTSNTFRDSTSIRNLEQLTFG